VRGEREIDVVAIRIEEAGADHGGFEIVVAHHRRHAAEVAERAGYRTGPRCMIAIEDRAGVPNVCPSRLDRG